jgi:16S rRNA processing protein RimM
MNSRSNKRIVVGALKGAHGVQGEVRVKSFTTEPGDLFTYGPLTDADGNVLVTPVSARSGKDHFIVAAREKKQKEEWDALKGALLHVERAILPEAEDDEFYIEDLVGLAVHAVDEVAEGGSSRCRISGLTTCSKSS